MQGPNVISTILVLGWEWTPLVGVCVPPTDVTTLEHLPIALDCVQGMPGQPPILLGNLNINMSALESDRDMAIATLLAEHGLVDMLPHFKSCHSHANTWQQYRKDGQRMSARCDYLLCRTRQRLQNVSIADPYCFSTDHLMVFGCLPSSRLGQNGAYLRARTRFPLRLPGWGPLTRLDFLFRKCIHNATAMMRSECPPW